MRWVAQLLVPLCDRVGVQDRPLAVAARVNDEVQPASQPCDLVAELDLLGRPVEVGVAQEEPRIL
jgi:hypothetical protein